MLTSKMGPFLVTIAFSCVRAKTIQKRNVWTWIFLKRRKNLRFPANMWIRPQCYFVASKSCSKWILSKSGLEQTEWDSQPRSELMTQTQSTGWQRGFPWRVMGPRLSAWCVIGPKLAAWAVIGHCSVMREIGLPLFHCCHASWQEFLWALSRDYEPRPPLGLISTVVSFFRVKARKIYVRKWNRANIWKATRKHKSWASFNVTFYTLSLFYLFYFKQISRYCSTLDCKNKWFLKLIPLIPKDALRASQWKVVCRGKVRVETGVMTLTFFKSETFTVNSYSCEM